MRTVPADVAAQIQPIPADFHPTFEDMGKFVRWSATVAVTGAAPMRVELGYSRAGGKADEAKESASLRAGAWQTMELARLGRADLLAYCSVNRHRRSAA